MSLQSKLAELIASIGADVKALLAADATKADAAMTMTYKGSIPTAANLDDYVETGLYMQAANANAAAGTNYPGAGNFAGMLEVINHATVYVWQKYRAYNSDVNFIRQRDGGVWSTWVQEWNEFSFDPASKLDASEVSVTHVADTVVRRNPSGYIMGNYINMTAGVTALTPTNVWVETGSDSYMRKQTLADLGAHLIANSAVGASDVTHKANISTNTTLSQTHAGGSLVCTAALTITCPTAGITTRAVFTILNRSSATITITGAGVMRLMGTTLTGNRTIGPYGVATILCYGGSEYWVTGPGVN